ncbi:hypothetical protein CCP1ISM_1120005 [Azospirillaceae bacterium]
MLLRLRHFDERRAPFGAFVDLVARQAAGRLKARTACRQAWEFLVDPQGADPADATGDDADDGRVRLTRFQTEAPGLALADFRHDLRLALDRASARLAETLALPGRGFEHRSVSRATWFRRRVELRRWLLAHGLAPPP